jgi:hypothetical protein
MREVEEESGLQLEPSGIFSVEYKINKHSGKAWIRYGITGQIVGGSLKTPDRVRLTHTHMQTHSRTCARARARTRSNHSRACVNTTTTTTGGQGEHPGAVVPARRGQRVAGPAKRRHAQAHRPPPAERRPTHPRPQLLQVEMEAPPDRQEERAERERESERILYIRHNSNKLELC